LPRFGDRPMHSLPQLFLDFVQLSPHAVPPGLPLEEEIAGEAGRRAGTPAPLKLATWAVTFIFVSRRTLRVQRICGTWSGINPGVTTIFEIARHFDD
jgi:hypothetical protein